MDDKGEFVQVVRVNRRVSKWCLVFVVHTKSGGLDRDAIRTSSMALGPKEDDVVQYQNLHLDLDSVPHFVQYTRQRASFSKSK
jgi:hypothetical protein